MRKILSPIAVLLTLVFTDAAAAPLTPDVQWKDPSSVQLEVDFPGNGYHASWDLHRCACGDLLIRSELSTPEGVAQGEILLVANRAVLVRGYSADDAAEISFDAPALMMQLTLRLLERAEPAGPSAISDRRQVDVEDAINYINLDTGAAAGGFPPPWRVQGAIWPQAETQRRFDLVFSFNAGGATGGEQDQGEMKLAGVAEYAATAFPLAEDMKLKGWDLSWRDENDAAAAEAEKAGTLAELRQLLTTP
jgi:hypothetical protein